MKNFNKILTTGALILGLGAGYVGNNIVRDVRQQIEYQRSSPIEKSIDLFANEFKKEYNKHEKKQGNFLNHLLENVANDTASFDSLASLLVKNLYFSDDTSDEINNSNSVIKKPYGFSVNPFDNLPSFHDGVDVTFKDSITTPKERTGTITSEGYDKVAGNFIVLSYGPSENIMVSYSHMKNNPKDRFSIGQTLMPGTFIGYQGNSGRTLSEHTHIGVKEKKQGKWLSEDPQKYLSFETDSNKKVIGIDLK